MFEPEVFRKQMYCTEVFVTLLGLFCAPSSHSAPDSDSASEELCPLAPRLYDPDYCAQRRASTNHGTQLSSKFCRVMILFCKVVILQGDDAT